MVTTFQALAIVVLAILPGATYRWGYEWRRKWEQWSPATLPDRLYHFLSAAVLYHLILGWLEYALWRTYLLPLQGFTQLTTPRFAALWVTVTMAMVLPFIFGGITGWVASKPWFERRVSRGWDAWVSTVSVEQRNAYIRVLVETDGEASNEMPGESASATTAENTTKDMATNRKDAEAWVGGYFGPRSFAGSPPNYADLFLERAYNIEEDGTFGEQLTYGIYIPADKINRLEVVYLE